ncbi:hypothetical protein [Azohydromonas australica]|uniref:hypothetical protein n=1 Tax=Azohydromonas australica TaxID=364039 RepID=UPI0012EC80D1|nr:hypothetical protein [Azohydromonas australica]
MKRLASTKFALLVVSMINTLSPVRCHRAGRQFGQALGRLAQQLPSAPWWVAQLLKGSGRMSTVTAQTPESQYSRGVWHMSIAASEGQFGLPQRCNRHCTYFRCHINTQGRHDVQMTARANSAFMT